MPPTDDLLSNSIRCVEWPTPHNLVVPGSNLEASRPLTIDLFLTGGEGDPLGNLASPAPSILGLIVLSNSTFFCTKITVIPENVPDIRHRKDVVQQFVEFAISVLVNGNSMLWLNRHFDSPILNSRLVLALEASTRACSGKILSPVVSE